MSGDQRIEHARLLYERAFFGGDASALGIAERELDGVEADLALARGRVLHARFVEDGNEDPHELATQAGDKLTLSYAVRHLGFADIAAGAGSAARERLEESVRLRREIGFSPGVAAGLVALAYLTAGEGHRDDALTTRSVSRN
jgi:hypothetical protein